jgi:hypothetical protein
MIGSTLKSWIEAATKRLHHNKLAIALANKLARIAWAVLHHGRNFEVRHDEYTPQPGTVLEAIKTKRLRRGLARLRRFGRL